MIQRNRWQKTRRLKTKGIKIDWLRGIQRAIMMFKRCLDQLPLRYRITIHLALSFWCSKQGSNCELWGILRSYGTLEKSYNLSASVSPLIEQAVSEFLSYLSQRDLVRVKSISKHEMFRRVRTHSNRYRCWLSSLLLYYYFIIIGEFFCPWTLEKKISYRDDTNIIQDIPGSDFPNNPDMLHK